MRTIETTVRASQSSPATPQQHGRRLVIMRVAWAAVAMLSPGLFVVGIPRYFAYLHFPCRTPPCSFAGQLLPDDMRALQTLGFSMDFYAAYVVALTAVFVFGYVAAGGVIFWRKADDRMARLASFSLVTFPMALNANLFRMLLPAWALPIQCLYFLGSICMSLFCYLFPQGEFVPGWTRWLAAGTIGYWGALSFFPTEPFNPFARFPVLDQVTFFGLLGSLVGVQLYRYWRVSNPPEREQTKWVVFGMSLTFGGFLALLVLYDSSFLALPQGGPGAGLIFITIATGLFLVLPLCIGIAIVRDRLWDIDLIINRTLVYVALTTSVVGIYVLVVGYLGALFQARGNLAISLVATALVAVLFQPLRDHFQHSVNRLMYGERDKPYAVISRLGRRLEGLLVPGDVLPTIVETVREALKLPYVAITLKQDANFDTVAESGHAGGELLRLPLVYQAETVGHLLLAPRHPGESFSPAEQRLLDDLARQAGVAAHAVRLTVDLQRSRERLVAAREEERRRLRRDLHDGLGPALAAQTLKVGTARYLVRVDPVGAETLLSELEADVVAALREIRHVVYNLRPPALDDLGLVAAIRASAGQYDLWHAGGGSVDGTRGLHVAVQAPEELGPLPAAVEVAAYRIVHEALTNVVRHAHAQNCQIQLALVEQGAQPLLCLDIADDGCGLPRECLPGVGLAAMRERAAELGGTCVVEPGPKGGTWVRACLPVAPPIERLDQP